MLALPTDTRNFDVLRAFQLKIPCRRLAPPGSHSDFRPERDFETTIPAMLLAPPVVGSIDNIVRFRGLVFLQCRHMRHVNPHDALLLFALLGLGGSLDMRSALMDGIRTLWILGELPKERAKERNCSTREAHEFLEDASAR